MTNQRQDDHMTNQSQGGHMTNQRQDDNMTDQSQGGHD